MGEVVETLGKYPDMNLEDLKNIGLLELTADYNGPIPEEQDYEFVLREFPRQAEEVQFRIAQGRALIRALKAYSKTRCN